MVEKGPEDFLRLVVTKRRLRLMQVVLHRPIFQAVEMRVPPGGGADVLHSVARRGVPRVEVVPRLSGLQMAAKKVPASVAASQVAAKRVV